MASDALRDQIVAEAASKGLRYAINDLRSAAAHGRDALEHNLIRLTAEQSWAYMEVVCNALEARLIHGAADDKLTDPRTPEPDTEVTPGVTVKVTRLGGAACVTIELGDQR